MQAHLCMVPTLRRPFGTQRETKKRLLNTVFLPSLARPLTTVANEVVLVVEAELREVHPLLAALWLPAPVKHL